ncbi:MAG: hypothetical protein GY856_19475 [bacterium]|nr:hypothetical protein [bacterium]
MLVRENRSAMLAVSRDDQDRKGSTMQIENHTVLHKTSSFHRLRDNGTAAGAASAASATASATPWQPVFG